MTRFNLFVAGLALLSLGQRARAETGPVLNPASGSASSEAAPSSAINPAPSETLSDDTIPGNTAPDASAEEIIQPGQVDGAESAPVAAVPSISAADRWRYQQYQGRWWYYSPDQRWFYWDTANWREAAGAAPRAVDSQFDPRMNVRLDPNRIPIWRGPPPVYGPPPLPGMPRYRGEPYIHYNGRPYRVQGAYANGFLQFSGPPAGYYWSGNGRMGFPYYNNW